ncbi:MAG TPA: hypothetical protein VMR19_01525 [Candidatus Saccharimonadales bacterium]|jgi:hypothetical protein|nr:hypothetical protein [Candidatus Saccharimonadales bacterium]
MPERQNKREQKYAEPLPEGAWESVLVALKTDLPLTPNETTGMGDSDFWIGIEDKATLKTNEACMEFYVRGVRHRALAEFVVFSFQAVRSAAKNGDGINKEQRRILVDRVADKLLNFYPPSYRAKFGR